MIQSSRLLRHICVLLCLLFLIFACAPESSFDDEESLSVSVGSGETSTQRAAATPTRVSLTPQASMRALATLVVEAPAPGIIKEDVEMMPTVSVPPGLQGLLDQTLDDLAERLDIDVDQISVVEVKAVVWPDGGLGCPQPGVVYTQVQQEGMLIRLRVGKRLYHYHSGGGRSPFFCEGARYDNLPPSPGLGNE